MDKLFYIAASGAKQNMLAQSSHANNLANANTVGFKSDMEQQRSMPVFGDGMPTRVFAMTERPASSFRHGSLITTGRDLDVAIKGDGFFVVQDDQGQDAFTRNGEFYVDPAGFLRTGGGRLVMGDAAAPINIPPAEKIEIATDGTISVRPIGAPPTALEVIDRIRLVNPDVKVLQKGEDGLFRRQDGQAEEPQAEVRLATGALEGSNVNAVDELMGLINHSRQFELQVKLMKTAEEMDSASARLLQN